MHSFTFTVLRAPNAHCLGIDIFVTPPLFSTQFLRRRLFTIYSSLFLSISSPVVITWFLHRWIRLLYIYVFHISRDPYHLTFFLFTKEEPLSCHHRQCISSFWCSSFAPFSQSFLLFCIVFGVFFLPLFSFSFVFFLFIERRRWAPRVCAVIVLEKPIFILHGIYRVVLGRCENSKESFELSVPPFTSIPQYTFTRWNWGWRKVRVHSHLLLRAFLVHNM
jgi:hypothetical protein